MQSFLFQGFENDSFANSNRKHFHKPKYFKLGLDMQSKMNN